MQAKVRVIGGGLAGCEAALQLARRGINVDLYEMRPLQNTPAHSTGSLAELVCSNSFKGLSATSAHGLFKEELQAFRSVLLHLAFEARVPAGESLTVDRIRFSALVEQAVEAAPEITLHIGEVLDIDPKVPTIVAAGPLCSAALSESIFKLVGREHLHFFDAIAPVVTAESVDYEISYFKNRWDKGESADFLNCPMNREQYEKFVKALCDADSLDEKPFEKKELFEGCLPVEELARRGLDTLRFGPMRPRGLYREKDGEILDKPWAVVQLRKENRQGSLYNMVGFQTRLRWGNQQKIFRMIPGLENAEFARLGAMHRNTFIDTPNVLEQGLRLPGTPVLFAGQITGAEGYTEAIATGLYAAQVMEALICEKDLPTMPNGCCLRALVDHLLSAPAPFQPMNFNFGLLAPVSGVPKKQRKEAMGKRAKNAWAEFNSTTFSRS